MVIRIEWLSDEVKCDTCGYNYADGAHVYFDDEFVIDMTPHAACFGGDDYDSPDVYKAILNKLGHVVEETYGGDE
jgi:hypothetical protein